MNIKGIYLFNSESGVTLFSRANMLKDIQEDLFSAFISAIKGFFKTLCLGGLSSFSTEQYMFYLSNYKNVCTTLIVELNDKSDKYFNISYDICLEFYNIYQNQINSQNFLCIPNVENFENSITNILDRHDKIAEKQSQLMRLYSLTKGGELEQFEYINEQQLFSKNLFVAVFNITKQVYVVENAEFNIPSRLLYLINKEASHLNQENFRSQFAVNKLSDPWDMERIVGVIDNLLMANPIKI